jgi:NADPH:quinone reductase-like Zn-dependent oxidoreductase
MASKPANLSLQEAAAVPMAAVTALQGLGRHGQLQPGQTVLINGGSGGVGSFAVQLAKAAGAEVTAVTSTPNLELVRSLGADHLIDYTRTGFTSVGRLLAVSLRGGKDIAQVQAHVTTRDLELLSELIETGKVRPLIDRRYRFADLPAAIAYLEQGHARAKVVIEVTGG